MLLALTAAAGVVLVAAAAYAFLDGEPIAGWHVLGVVGAGVFVTAFPLVLGSGRSRAAYVLDGVVFVMAALLLPFPDALLAVTLPTVVFELVSARRDLDRRLYFAAGTTLSNLVALGLFSLVAAVTDRDLVLVPVAVACAFVGIAVYHAGMIGLARLGGVPWSPNDGVLAFLLPAAGIYAASAAVGAGLALIGERGAVEFLVALAIAMAFHVLYWEYCNMVLARTRTDRLFGLATELPGLSTADAVERRATTVAADLLQCDRVDILEQPPAPPEITAAMNVRGRVRWLVPSSALSNIRGAAEEERRALQAVARVAASALERLDLEAELRAESRRDPLTGVLNRAAFDGELRAAIARARRDQRSFAIAYGDLDGFKPINDDHGHQVGDEVLRHVAERLRSGSRAGDVVARIGGDEFVLLLHPPAGELDVAAAVSRAQAEVAAPMTVDGRRLQVGISLGAASWPEDGDTPQALIRAADLRMYEAKRRGRDAER
ncbi:MAG TPA: GGDEF domain-containing protein [Egicoccus sp.]|nr:GGDEF domain-containing protein [Egicoccus sp.]HSK22271.1 GGDEF domain-containing protein [Egicoccus sp.]